MIELMKKKWIKFYLIIFSIMLVQIAVAGTDDKIRQIRKFDGMFLQVENAEKFSIKTHENLEELVEKIKNSNRPLNLILSIESVYPVVLSVTDDSITIKNICWDKYSIKSTFINKIVDHSIIISDVKNRLEDLIKILPQLKKKLIILESKLGSRGLCLLSESLKNNTILEELSVLDDSIYSKGIKALVAVLKENQTMKSVNLNGSMFNAKYIKLFQNVAFSYQGSGAPSFDDWVMKRVISN